MLLELWFIYLVTTFTSVITPGPSMFLALYHGGQYGKKRTLATALGTVLASLILGAISAVGLGVILSASLIVFQLIKWLGAAYLIYLGVNLWRNSSQPVKLFEAEGASQQRSVDLFRQAFWVALGNPKPIIFFAAFFPQFINLQQAQTPQYLIMLGTLALVVFGCAMLYALGGEKLRPWLRNFRVKQWLDRLAGGLFIGFGIRLACSK
jgi:threonine/homoserine/homoserine lactone efflux protein